MLIHSVTPAEFLQPGNELPARGLMRMGASVLEGDETPEGFRVSRICSTDLSMYLRREYEPGRIIARK